MSSTEHQPPEPAAVRERIHSRAARIRERELEKALAEFDDGELTDAQRELVVAFARQLTHELLAPVEESLRREAAANADACRRLFLRE